MSLESFFCKANAILGIPATIIFLCVGIILTIKTKFIQIRALPRLFSFFTKGIERLKLKDAKTINPFHALFASMAGSVGIGNIVGPSVAITMGGPGALFWLIAYMFFGAVSIFTESTFAFHTRKITKDGNITSGPTEYLKLVSKWLSSWYGLAMMILFGIWSGTQTNTLANILAKESIPHWWVGLSMAAIVIIILRGGAKRVGYVASKLVPFMCVLYVAFSLFIIFKDLTALKHAFSLIFSSIFSPAAAVGGFAGATILKAMRWGVFKSVHSTEAGMGTASITHSVADAKRPVDQGILSMLAILVDGLLCLLSGIIIIVTGLWCTSSVIDSTLIYTAFKAHTPILGDIILVISVALFATTSVIGNSFMGIQTYASLTKHRLTNLYIYYTAIAVFIGSIVSIPLVWHICDFVLIFVAVPNVVSLAILAFKKPDVLKLPQ